VQTIIWFSFLLAVFIYGLVGFVVGPALEAGLPTWLLPVVGLVFTMGALLLPSWLSGRVTSRAGGAAAAPPDLLFWAFDELVAIVGLISVLLGGTWQGMLPYLLVSLALLWLHRPRP
jgi:hypothetical protein